MEISTTHVSDELDSSVPRNPGPTLTHPYGRIILPFVFNLLVENSIQPARNVAFLIRGNFPIAKNLTSSCLGLTIIYSTYFYNIRFLYLLTDPVHSTLSGPRVNNNIKYEFLWCEPNLQVLWKMYYCRIIFLMIILNCRKIRAFTLIRTPIYVSQLRIV